MNEPQAQNPTPKLVVASEHPSDRVGETKTIYQVSAWTIFWRHFLAGVSRTLGSLIIYLVFLGLISFYLYRFIWPTLMPIFQNYTRMMSVLTNTQTPVGETSPQTQTPTVIDPALIDQIINQIQNK